MKLNQYAIPLIALSILITCSGMCFPILGSTFSPYYASIAKHIVISNNWANLVLSGQDWLDKPHFPFWVTALSFKIFGINSFAYIFPGFIFNLIGAIYTYKLSKIWHNTSTSILSALFYLTTLHLMLSSIDIRAEAYLLGEIMPACYYFLKFYKTNLFRFILLGSFFSGMALMTKGMFVLVTICSGIICLWLYNRQLKNFTSYKWWICLLLPFGFAIPEIISLYLQFDLHPNKIVFGATHVSGIKWFFWDSQFGRFFNTGPIATTNPMPYHWLFFVHTFLWAFLPWWPIFFYALAKSITDIIKKSPGSEANVFLLGSFFITFILFSATSFQVDHYTNIIFPFACILSAKYLNRLFTNNKPYIWLVIIETAFSCIFIIISIALNYLMFKGITFVILLIIELLVLCFIFYTPKINRQNSVIVSPILSILMLFFMVMCVNGIGYKKYDVGYNIAKILNKKNNLQIINYNLDSVPLKSAEFYLNHQIKYTNQLDFKPDTNTYVITADEYSKQILDKYNNSKIAGTVYGCEIGTYIENIYNTKNIVGKLHKYVIIKLQ